MIYLLGSGGVTWKFAGDDYDQLPEYARHQLKTGDLQIAPAPEGDEPPMERPSNNASKDEWVRYVRSFDGAYLDGEEIKSYTKRDLIQWADELEAEEEKNESKSG
jgi:hypothetical protein